MGETAWNDSERSTLTAVAFLRAKLEGWKIGAELIETSVANAREVITYILKDQARCPEGVLRVVYNGLELRTDITYQGSRTAHLPISRATYAPVAGELENEEAAAYVGLRNFLRGLAVDRQEVKVQKGRVIVRLFYAA